MTPENRVKFDAICKKARTGDELAVKCLRSIAAKFCVDAPVPTVIRVCETFNDAYLDEQIEWATHTLMSLPELE